MSKKINSLTTKRFVIRKSLIGSNQVISFTNKKGVSYTYNHDEVYNAFKAKFEAMPCFENTSHIPTLMQYQHLQEA